MFKDYLRGIDQNRVDINKLLRRLTSQMMMAAELSPMEQDIFSDPAKIGAVLSDPMVNLVKSPKELEMMDDPTAEFTASISPGKKTLGTRRLMLMRRDTTELLKKVSQVF